MSEYYWEIVLREGDRIRIPPHGVEVVRRRWANKEPVSVPGRSIAPSEIKDFKQTSELYNQKLLEEVHQAFNDPLETENGIASRWVKKSVTSHEYNKHYGGIPSYKKLREEGSMVEIAFKLPIHLIDTTKVERCNELDVERLTQDNS